ncbi:MAG: diguanylate cyclase [Mariprofundales bacterium]|nr:diguanylate cyclase [Mariprofundales bacterium]
MKLRKKKNLFVLISMVVMIVLFSGVSLLSFRYFSLDTVRSTSKMAAEMVRVALTEEMEKGLIGERADLIARMNRVEGLRDVHVVRGQPVINQFGPGNESEKPVSEQEKTVLRTGKVVEDMSEFGTDTYKVTIPFIASRFNDINCMNCHEVPEGSVNGAVTLTFSLEKQRHTALLAVLPILGLLIIFGMMMAFFLKRLLDPVVKTAEDVKTALRFAQSGDFSHRVTVLSDDEVGDIARDTNAFVEALESSVGAIGKKIEAIGVDGIGRTDVKHDLLTHTMHVVDDMVNAARFKQEIEEDFDLNEVYDRMRRILQERFNLDRFCLYEVDAESGKLRVLYANGVDQSVCSSWCDPAILVDSDQCRAKRTSHGVCSCDAANICAAFRPEREGDQHLCIPLMLSDRVGNVLQVILRDEAVEQAKELRSAIEAHLTVASPVIESKRLMQSLKESTLRDPMTGLYNRRFLEEFSGNMTASVVRRKSLLGILMLDVDWFKKVNDEYGHDVGDQVLKALSDIISQEVRESDVVIRYGGEEFIALLPDITSEGVANTAERIRARMEATVVQTSGGPIKKTISIGYSIFPEDAGAFWQCVKFADIALYAAKDSGRNRVLPFVAEMWKDEEGY